jgi:phage repressor protein C with HTH and peptisase S24 domain
LNDITIRFLEVYDYLFASKKVNSYNDFAKKIGISSSLINEISKKRTNAGLMPIQNTVNNFTEISSEWLLTGKGKMLKSSLYQNSDYEKYVVEPIKNYRRTKDAIKDMQEIPLYNLQATAGLVELFKGTYQDAVIDNIKIPGIASCDGAVYVSGDSMYPLLKSGDIVLYKEVDISRLFWGEMYLLSAKVTDWEEYITVKFVQKSELGKEYVKLVSQNPHHQPKDVLLSDISAIALIRASIRIQAS